MFSFSNSGSHACNPSMSDHDRMLLEANARCLICSSLTEGEGDGGMLLNILSERMIRSSLENDR